MGNTNGSSNKNKSNGRTQITHYKQKNWNSAIILLNLFY